MEIEKKMNELVEFIEEHQAEENLNALIADAATVPQSLSELATVLEATPVGENFFTAEDQEDLDLFEAREEEQAPDQEDPEATPTQESVGVE